MSVEMRFFIYLLACYAEHKNKPTATVLKTWDESGITGKIYEKYWGYHTERLENAFDDIDAMLSASGRC